MNDEPNPWYEEAFPQPKNEREKVNMPSLKGRGVRGGLVHVYKWMARINEGDVSKVFRAHEWERTSRNGLKAVN